MILTIVFSLLIMALSVAGFAAALLFLGWSYALLFDAPAVIAYLEPSVTPLVICSLLLPFVHLLAFGQQTAMRSLGLGPLQAFEKQNPLVFLGARMHTWILFVFFGTAVYGNLETLPAMLTGAYLALFPLSIAAAILAPDHKPTPTPTTPKTP